jgi:hypothetical protein
VTHRSGFFLVAGLNLLLIFDPLLILRVLSFNLFPKKPASRFFAYVSVFFLGRGRGCFSLEFGLWRRFVVFMRLSIIGFLVSVWLARKLTIIAKAEQAVRRQEEESEERWVRQIGEEENGCVCGLRVKL